MAARVEQQSQQKQELLKIMKEERDYGGVVFACCERSRTIPIEPRNSDAAQRRPTHITTTTWAYLFGNCSCCSVVGVLRLIHTDDPFHDPVGVYMLGIASLVLYTCLLLMP